MTPNTSITIRTSEGDYQVLANVFGAWAVHRAWRGNGWAITHVASGLRVPDGYLEGESKKRVIAVAKGINAKFGNVTPGDSELGKAIAAEIWSILFDDAAAEQRRAK